MRYKLLNSKNTFGRKIKDIVLENRGLSKEDVERLLNPKKDYMHNPMDIYGMKEAVDKFNEIVRGKEKDVIVGILVDEDVDGYTSSALPYKWLIDDVGVPKENIRVIFQKRKKAHGIGSGIINDLLKSDVDLFIIADSSTNDLEEQKQLIKKGKDVIILDHHDKSSDEFVKGVYLVNNQIGDNPHKHLSGVGVVAMFIKALGYDIDKYMDLVAVGGIADSMDMTNLQNAYIAYEGLNNVQNELIKECFKDIDQPIIQSVSWNCANYINSVVRAGNNTDRDVMWRALIGEEDTVEYKKRDKTIINQSLAEAFIRLSGNARNRQNTKIKKGMKELEKIIHKHNLQNDICIIIENLDEDGKAILESSLCGVTAQKLLSKYGKAVIILNPYDGEMSGSVRSPFDLKDILIESGLVTFAEGHSKACGCGLPKENIDKLRNYLNVKCQDIELGDTTYEVDYVFNANEIDLDTIKEIVELSPLWRKGIEEPTFIIKNITIESKDIKHGKTNKGWATSFKCGNMHYTKNFSSQDTFDNMTMKKELKFGRTHTLDYTVLVKMKKNDRGFYYLSIEDYNVTKSSKINF